MKSLKEEERKKRKWISNIILLLIGAFIILFLSFVTDQLLINGFDLQKIKFSYKKSIIGFFTNSNQRKLFYLFAAGWALFLWINTHEKMIAKAQTIKITDKIKIPQAIGEGQHGTSRFMTETELKDAYSMIIYDRKKKMLNRAGNIGIVFGMEQKADKEKILCLTKDEHAIIIGATRSGKSRTVIIETIWLRGLAKKSMIVTDPKGELYLYTYKYLKASGVEPVAFDLRQPKKSRHYNYMQTINRAVEEDDIPAAIDYTWDLVSVLVGVPKGEPLWTNGESAVIAASILAVALEAPKEYRNLTNAYYFIANMCKSDEEGEMLISRYFRSLPEEHPAKGIFAVAEISPERTRGSFFGSALATLRLFTNWNIADITAESEFDLRDIGKRPMALFLIIPDEKKTLYSLVSLLISQVYISLIEVANRHGGRVPCEVDFLCDEFGNCPVIPGFGTMLSAGAGRGIRFALVLQDYQQLEKNYKDDYENIKGNCQNTIYLKTPSQKTLEELSKRTGTYSCQVNTANGSVSGTGMSGRYSYSGGSNLQSRSLLLPAEIGRIDRPYTLILRAGDYPAIIKAPDLRYYEANKELGLGNEQHNNKMIMERDAEREARDIKKMNLWGIWDQYKEQNISSEAKEKISFLD